jgi:Kef-type K+ transport system membrane component KefB
LFLGATLTATSVGITAAVLRDMRLLQSKEARIILGAAVIDDVLGLVILAVVTSLVQGGEIGVESVVLIIGKAAIFLGGAIFLGRMVAPRLGRHLSRISAGVAMKLTLVVVTGLVLAWLAHQVGLAAIVGAFAAGLALEPAFLKDFDRPELDRELRPLASGMPAPHGERVTAVLDRHSTRHHEQLLEPLGYVFVPIFFVFTGMQVKLETLGSASMLGVAIVVTVAAIVGKLVAGVAAGPVRRWLVGWGINPRGEVGLIFAMVGKQLGVLGEQLFSIIVVMVMLTTLITPPVLAWLGRR